MTKTRADIAIKNSLKSIALADIASSSSSSSAAAGGGATSPYNSDVDGDTEAEDRDTQGDHHDSETGSPDESLGLVWVNYMTSQERIN